MTRLLAPGEVERGSWDVVLNAPDGTPFGGAVLVTDRRLLFHAHLDLTHRGEWLEILHMRQRFNPRYPESLQGYVTGEGKTTHLSIPRQDVTRVELIKGLLRRDVRLTLSHDRVLVFHNAGFVAKKIVAALG